MQRKDAENLWNAIIDFAGATGEMCGEGNSGEFHDENDARAIQRELNTAEFILISIFSNNTGWLPTFFEGTPEKCWNDQKWVLKKRKIITRRQLNRKNII
jgi:hypothetical protein